MRLFTVTTLSLLVLSAGLSRADENPHGDVFKNRPVPAVVDFSRDVLPIISAKCYHCHGQDEGSRKAELRLDQRDEAVKLRDGTFAIKPSDPAHSTIMERVRSTDPDEVMPPPKESPALSAREIAILEKWVAQGAAYADHWSFIPPRKVAPPGGHAKDGNNPIDAFVHAKLAEEKLAPSAEAGKSVLIRRLALDLTGLPPSPEEVARFTSTPYEVAVDHFMAKPAYGERWARVWLDLARYADSAGYGSDPLRMNIWPYRDWVIKAFNENKPYDQFTIEQLAGDLLPNATREQKVATAFHRNTMTNTEGGTDDEEFRVAAVKDRAGVTMQVWMGLTMACAQCHSHKFDPISQKEYYEFFAIFNQTEDQDKPDETPTLALGTAEEAARLKTLEEKVTALQKLETLRKEAAELEKSLAQKPIADENAAKQAATALTASIKSAQSQAAKARLLSVPVLLEKPKDKQRETRLLVKGNFLMPGDMVKAALPKAFHKDNIAGSMDRLHMAKWIVSRENPLTARVAVNRFWAQLFGSGLVETEEDFGTQGTLPSHPELLDWLAVEFMDQGWDMKALIKSIVMSQTYRQVSRASGTAAQNDPRNRWLSHYPRRRLDAEQVRDQALAVSGLLSTKLGGPSVFPPQPDGLWRAAFNGQRTWETSTGENRYRRGLYTFWRRTVPYPSMATFDAPSRENSTLRRLPTNTPLQAFVTLNDPAYVEMARALARRLMKEGGSSPESRIRFGLELCLSRPASEEQVPVLANLYRDELASYQADARAAKELASPVGNESAAELAAWTVVANILLNLDGMLTLG